MTITRIIKSLPFPSRSYHVMFTVWLRVLSHICPSLALRWLGFWLARRLLMHPSLTYCHTFVEDNTPIKLERLLLHCDVECNIHCSYTRLRSAPLHYMSTMQNVSCANTVLQAINTTIIVLVMIMMMIKIISVLMVQV